VHPGGLDLFTNSVKLIGDATHYAVIEFDRRLDPCIPEEARSGPASGK